MAEPQSVTPATFSRKRKVLSAIVIAALPALLIGSFVWKDLALAFLTVAILIILIVASFGAREMKKGPARGP